jgi:hypothetical protein
MKHTYMTEVGDSSIVSAGCRSVQRSRNEEINIGIVSAYYLGLNEHLNKAYY